MPAKLQKPVVERIFLIETDERLGNEGEASYVEIRQARIMDSERRADVTSKRSVIQGTGKDAVKVESRFNFPELMRYDVQLTLVGCNLLDADEKPLFQFKDDTVPPRLAMSDYEFVKAWSQLDDATADEIHNAVLRVNPNWGVPTGEEPDF